jgi:hypothetical protein
MKHTVLRTALLFSLIVAGLLLFNYLFIEYVVPDITVYESYDQWMRYSNETSVLIMGDSHAANDLDPKRFCEHSFNYAIGGEVPGQTLLRLDAALKQTDTIQYIILPFEPQMFSDYRHDPYGTQTGFWLRFLGYGELMNRSGKRFLSVLAADKFPVMGHGKMFLERVIYRNRSSPMEKGWQTMRDDYANNPDKIAAAVGRYHSQVGNTTRFDAANFADYQRIIALANSNNVKVILVRYPLTREFREFLENDTALGERMDSLLSQVNNTGNVIAVLDYRAWDDDPHRYSDMDHLNEMGSSRFSSELAERLDICR